jgi:hypothetical protein
MTLRTAHIIAVVAKTLPRNADVADQFDLLADFLELEGSDQFRPLAYRRAAQRMRETGGSIAQLALDGKAKELPGIGKTIEEKIVQIVKDGRIEALAKREASTPPDVVEFMRLPGLGPKTARRIWQELGITRGHILAHDYGTSVATEILGMLVFALILGVLNAFLRPILLASLVAIIGLMPASLATAMLSSLGLEPARTLALVRTHERQFPAGLKKLGERSAEVLQVSAEQVDRTVRCPPQQAAEAVSFRRASAVD